MRILLLLSLLLVFGRTYAQQNDHQHKLSETNAVPFAIIQNPPVYKGCYESGNSSNLKRCMSDRISELFKMKFNTSVADSIDLKGSIRISVLFTFEIDGSVSFVEAKAPHDILKKEAERIVSLIPKLTRPGMQDNEPVGVSYIMPIVFKIPKKEK